MNIKEILEKRRATRSFRPDRIPSEILEEILRLGCLAPSSYNLQPWRFIVVTEAEHKAKLREFGFEQDKLTEASAVLICCGDRQVAQRKYINKVIELGKQVGSMTEKRVKFMHMAIPPFFQFKPSYQSLEAWSNRQVMIAVTCIMIAAQSLGVDSCPIEGFVAKPLREYFQIPDHVDVCCLLALGYAAEPYSQYGGRFGLDQLCYGEIYGEAFELGSISHERTVEYT
ncbi:MAG: nitroreductase family protein [Desmonostoc geniculatum HA4340-LM1]|jgi:nitroreductase|nr:nitroreductase family protein [Desmonostoc geniculatum HA4340-LM1]